MPVLYFLLPNIALPRAGARPCVSSMQISKAMSGVVKGMGRALKEMDMDKISKIMDKFEEEDERFWSPFMRMSAKVASSPT